MDPLVLYTVKLAMARRQRQGNEHHRHPMPLHNGEIPFDVFYMETRPMLPSDRPPRLEKHNLVSLVYHADEQRIASVRQLGSSGEVHRQQRILLDTLHVLHKGALCTNKRGRQRPRRFQEGIVFAAQVLHHGYTIRHLDDAQQHTLHPLADRLYMALQDVRHLARALALSAAAPLPSPQLLDRLNRLMETHDAFESALYASYSHAVFGGSPEALAASAAAHEPLRADVVEEGSIAAALPPELFCDALTQLLPVTLERALAHKLVALEMLQDLDPVAFIALPRLAVLAGTTWLSHLSRWRQARHPCLATWFDATHADTAVQLLHAVDQLETHATPAAFVERHRRIERALVHGWRDAAASPLEHTVYTHVCAIADGLRAGPNARSFNMVLRHLFAPFHPHEEPPLRSDPDAVSESTVLELAI